MVLGSFYQQIMENKDTYFVAVKAFILDEEGNILITKDRFGDWDMPGGRLREEDFNTPLEEVLARKIREELGESVTYELGSPAVFMRHERDEVMSDGSRQKRRIFAIGYGVKFKGGEIKLGANHAAYEWVPLGSFDPAARFTGGWLRGLQDFQAAYLKNISHADR